MFSPEEWAALPADQRRQAIGDMSQIQAAKLYAAIPENNRHSPRLTQREWMALGKVGQDYLIGYLPDWEADLVVSWTARQQDSFIPAYSQRDRSSEAPSAPNEPSTAPVDGPWATKTMDSLILWSCALPIIGIVLFVFNFWKPGKLKQSFGLLVAAIFMALLGYPFILGLVSALFR